MNPLMEDPWKSKMKADEFALIFRNIIPIRDLHISVRISSIYINDFFDDIYRFLNLDMETFNRI